MLWLGNLDMKVVVIAKPGLFADALRHWLRALFPGFQVLVCPASGTRARHGKQVPRLALIDVDDLPKGNLGSEIRKFRERSPSACIVAMGSPAGREFASSLIRIGADAYLPKGHDEGKALAIIGKALMRSAKATSAASRSSASRSAISARHDQASRENPYRLTPRELDMLELACLGLSNLQIAKHHNISAGVVKLHLHSAYAKLGVQGRVQAIRIVEHMDAIRSLHLKRVDSAGTLLNFLLPHMSHERHSKGDVLFRKGDQGNAMYYVQKGRVRLAELDVNMTDGEVFGELGVFAPTRVRTSSARCEGPTDLFKLTADQTQRLCFENPRFAYYMIRLIADRLVEERAGGAG